MRTCKYHKLIPACHLKYIESDVNETFHYAANQLRGIHTARVVRAADTQCCADARTTRALRA